MSHSTNVFENNYMSWRMHKDLAKLRFGAFAGSNDDLSQALCHLTLMSDPEALINPTPEQLEYIESRRDVTKLREKLELAQQQKNAKEVRKL